MSCIIFLNTAEHFLQMRRALAQWSNNFADERKYERFSESF